MTNKQHNQNHSLNKIKTRRRAYKKKNKKDSQRASANPNTISPQKLEAGRCRPLTTNVGSFDCLKMLPNATKCYQICAIKACPQKSSNALSFEGLAVKCRQMSSNVSNFEGDRLAVKQVCLRANEGKIEVLAHSNHCGESRQLAVVSSTKKKTKATSNRKIQTFPLVARYKREIPLNLICSQVQFMLCVAKRLL